MKYLSIFSIVLVFLQSCSSGNTKNIEVSGVIFDSLTGKPIPEARVTVLCWRYLGSDEETYNKIDTVTNSQGAFAAKFDEGFKVDIGSIAAGYHPVVQQIADLNKSSNISLKLHRKSVTDSLLQLGYIPVFARDYNTKPAIPRTFHGINILGGKNTSSPDSIDISIMQYHGNGYPKTLITPEKGGIVPIFDKSQNAINKAPQSGYVSKYKITGDERGFFVRCRDGKTYARLMLYSLEYDHSGPYKGGAIKELGIMFEVELQAAGREFNSPEDLRLDYYILDHI